MTPDWNADGTAAADVLIRRLEFPIKAVMANHVDPYIEIVLGQPDTTERDIQPLRRGMVVRICWAEEGVQFSGTLVRVGEGVVTVRPTGRRELVMAGRSGGPDRMIRPEQYVGG